jgi:hypothetical protein
MKLKKCKLPSFKGNGLNKRKLLTLPIAAGLLMGMFTLPASAATVTISTGDVDGDGLKSKITDIILLSKILTSKQTVFNWSVADINGDGTVSKSDLALLIAQLSGTAPLSPERTEETTSWTGETRTYNVYDYSCDADESGYTDLIDTYDIEDAILSNYLPHNTSDPGNGGTSEDNRVPYQDSSIVQFVAGTHALASGTIVGPHQILFSSHQWELHKNYIANQDYCDLLVKIRDWDDEGIAFVDEMLKIQQVHIPNLWLTSPVSSTVSGTMTRTNYDYAIAVVEEDLTSYGIVELGIALNSLIGKDVTSAGYPHGTPYPEDYLGDENENDVPDYGDYRLFSDEGVISKFAPIRYTGSSFIQTVNANDQLNMTYRASTRMSGGHSGGCLFINSGDNAIQVGLTTQYGSYTLNGVVYRYTAGVRISPSIYNFVNNNPYFD